MRRGDDWSFPGALFAAMAFAVALVAIAVFYEPTSPSCPEGVALYRHEWAGKTMHYVFAGCAK